MEAKNPQEKPQQIYVLPADIHAVTGP